MCECLPFIHNDQISDCADLDASLPPQQGCAYNIPGASFENLYGERPGTPWNRSEQFFLEFVTHFLNFLLVLGSHCCFAPLLAEKVLYALASCALNSHFRRGPPIIAQPSIDSDSQSSFAAAELGIVTQQQQHEPARQMSPKQVQQKSHGCQGESPGPRVAFNPSDAR